MRNVRDRARLLHSLRRAVLEVTLILGTASLELETDALVLQYGLELTLLSVGGRHVEVRGRGCFRVFDCGCL